MPTHFTLAHTLGLRPLDRVQLNSRETLREMRNDAHMGRAHEDLPFWFFQRITPDGQIEVMSPGGSTQHVRPTEICDVIKGEPIEVMAMPEAVWLQRARLPIGERQGPIPDSCYSHAYVRWVRKDRWNQLDQAYVTFHDEALNSSPTRNSPLMDADRQKLQGLMSRRIMPVVGPGSASYSANHGASKVESDARYAVSSFIHCARTGLDRSKATICEAGAAPISTAMLNRLMASEAAAHA